MKVRVGVIAFAISILALPAFSSTILISGTVPSSGNAVSATLLVTSSSSTQLSVEVLNTTSNINNISEVFDGLTFTLGSGATLSLASDSAASFVDCTGANVTTAGCATITPSASSPYGWTVANSSGNFNLFAGGGSWKPYGVIDSGACIGAGNGCSGLHNSSNHNPLAIDMTFNFLGTNINLANFSVVSSQWGTSNGDKIYGGTLQNPPTYPQNPPTNNDPIPQTPEPGSLALFGSGMLGLSGIIRRRMKRLA